MAFRQHSVYCLWNRACSLGEGWTRPEVATPGRQCCNPSLKCWRSHTQLYLSHTLLKEFLCYPNVGAVIRLECRNTLRSDIIGQQATAKWWDHAQCEKTGIPVFFFVQHARKTKYPSELVGDMSWQFMIFHDLSKDMVLSWEIIKGYQISPNVIKLNPPKSPKIFQFNMVTFVTCHDLIKLIRRGYFPTKSA